MSTYTWIGPHGPQHTQRLSRITGEYPNRIRYYRLSKGWTQQELADRIGVKNRKSVSNWERGIRLPKITTALRLARQLNRLVEDLYWPVFHNLSQ